jgi:hypothetical protein
MGFTNPAAATGVVTVTGTVTTSGSVTSAPSGAVPATTIASAGQFFPGSSSTWHIIGEPFAARYLLVWAQVTLLNIGQGNYVSLTIQDTDGAVLLGPFYAYGTTDTNAPNAVSVQGQHFDLGQYDTGPSRPGIDVLTEGVWAAESAWSVNIGYADVADGYPGHIIG